MVSQNCKKMGKRELGHAHFRCFVVPRLILDMAYLCTKFEASSFTRAKIQRGPEIKNPTYTKI